MYDAVLQSGTNIDLSANSDTGIPARDTIIKPINLPFNPPPVEPKFRVITNKRAENISRLENQLQFWANQKNINPDIKYRVYKDILSSLSRFGNLNTKKRFFLKNLGKRTALPLQQPAPKKAALSIQQPTPQKPKKLNWSDIEELLNTSKKNKKQKKRKIP